MHINGIFIRISWDNYCMYSIINKNDFLMVSIDEYFWTETKRIRSYVAWKKFHEFLIKNRGKTGVYEWNLAGEIYQIPHQSINVVQKSLNCNSDLFLPPPLRNEVRLHYTSKSIPGYLYLWDWIGSYVLISGITLKYIRLIDLKLLYVWIFSSHLIFDPYFLVPGVPPKRHRICNVISSKILNLTSSNFLQ